VLPRTRRSTAHHPAGPQESRLCAGKYNGFGGKIENGETPALAAIRELWEECGARVALEDLRPVAYLDFRFPAQPAWDQVVHVFLAARWEGTPAESAEMAPAWFSIDKLPRQRMWQDDPHWLPRVLAGSGYGPGLCSRKTMKRWTRSSSWDLWRNEARRNEARRNKEG